MDSNDLKPRLARARSALRDLEHGMAQRHGVCRIEVSLSVVPDGVRVGGHVLVDRLRQPVLEAVQAVLPEGCAAHDAMRVVQGGVWHSVDTPTELSAAVSGGARVTVLHPEDGPIECLGQVGEASLVRDRCGTAAWTRAPLGPVVETPRLPRPVTHDPVAFVAAARRFEGTAYSLGGTDLDTIDCSGVVQRAAWSALRVAVPRNTGDLWGLGAKPGKPPAGVGHLVFIWTQGETLRHVGVVAGGEVVHASLSRQRVVSDPAQRFYAHAVRVDHLPFEALVELGERCAGHPNILAGGVRLGLVDPTRPPTRA